MFRRIRSATIKTTVTGIVVVGALEITTHLPSEGRSSSLYHYVCDDVVTAFLRTWLNPEDAHNVALEMTRRGFAPTYRPMSFSRDVSSSAIKYKLGAGMTIDTSCRPFKRHDPTLVFPNVIGLAAGFDKDGVAIDGLLNMGFGFVEVGSVTPRPQPGNPKPRMFRLSQDRGVINRYGFNSIGVDGVETNLRRYRGYEEDGEEEEGGSSSSTTQQEAAADDNDGYKEGDGKEEDDNASSTMMDAMKMFKSALRYTAIAGGILAQQARNVGQLVAPPVPSSARPRGLVGINVGKNKDSDDILADYTMGIRHLGPYADYLVINISSPNTPGLRNLQQEEPLRELLMAVIRERDSLPARARGGTIIVGSQIPLLVKIAPDLTDDEMESIAKTVMECDGLDGLVISNTSTSRPSTLLSKHRIENGGLSGEPLRDISTDCIRKMYRYTNGTIPIIGVGGVSSGHDVYEKLRAGASVVQVYTALVYNGPGLISRLNGDLEAIMAQNGLWNVDDVIGLDHDDIYWKKREEKELMLSRKRKEEARKEPVILS